MCGHYGQLRNLTWKRADTLIWLDYPLGVVLPRLLRRTFARWWRQEILWGTNRERLWDQFCSKESLFLYVLETSRKRHYQYPTLVKLPEFSHLRVLRFRSPAQTQAWLDGMAAC
jgi:hypothetical protein